MLLRRGSIRVLSALLSLGLALSVAPLHATPLHTRQADPAGSPPLVRFTIAPPAAQPIRITADRDLAISPDGTRLVYVADLQGQPAQLMVRAIDELDAVPLNGITRIRSPFFSPDGKWVGYYASGELRKVLIAGGASVVICRTAGALRGASWSQNGTIVFATDSSGTGLFTVLASGGDAKVLTTPDSTPAKVGATFPAGEAAHQLPSWLPGGHEVLFTVREIGSIDTAAVAVAVLDVTTGRRKTLIRGGSQAEYLSTGHLVFAARGELRAVRFDLARLVVDGDPVSVVDHVMSKLGGAADFTVSRRGALAYVPGGAGGLEFKPNSLVWVDRQGGVEQSLELPSHNYFTPRLSPDGKRVALGFSDADRGFRDLRIGVWDLEKKALTPLPFRDVAFPVWTPDGQRIISCTELATGGVANLYSSAADGTGPLERLTNSPNDQWTQSISPDGRSLVFLEFPRNGARRAWNLGLLPLGAERASSETLMRTPANKLNAEVSPDGHWLAYQSNESGRNEVYVRPFPQVDGESRKISASGGTAPVWARNGRELFFLDASGLLMTVPIQSTPTFKAGDATRILYAQFQPHSAALRNYDVSPDGQRFLMIKETPVTIVMVVNWFDDLRRRVLHVRRPKPESE